MATQENTSATDITGTRPFPERIEGAGITLDGLLGILTRHGEGWNGLTDAALATVSNQLDNLVKQQKNSLAVIGNLISSHDPKADDLDHIGIGWALRSLVDDMETLQLAESQVHVELEIRGFNEYRSMLATMARSDA